MLNESRVETAELQYMTKLRWIV